MVQGERTASTKTDAERGLPPLRDEGEQLYGGKRAEWIDSRSGAQQNTSSRSYAHGLSAVRYGPSMQQAPPASECCAIAHAAHVPTSPWPPRPSWQTDMDPWRENPGSCIR